MAKTDTTRTSPLMTSLAYLYETARQQGDVEAMEAISEQMRAERERIAAGTSPPPIDPAYRVDLCEDNAGVLYLVGPDRRRGLTYVVTEGDDAGFELDAVALQDGDTAEWTVPSLPTALLNQSSLTLIASYDGAMGTVSVERDPSSGRVIASANGRRYIGYLEGED